MHPGARQRRRRHGLDVGHLRLPALEVRNRHARTYERVRALVEVLAVTPRDVKGYLEERVHGAHMSGRPLHDQTTRRARRPGPRSLGGAPVLPGRALQGRDRGRARPEPVQDRPSAGHGPGQRTGPHRDRSPGTDRRRSGRADHGQVRAEARVVVDTQDDHAESMRRHLGQVAAELLAEVIGPGGRARRRLVTCGRRDGQSAAPPLRSTGRPAHRSHLDAGRRSQLDRHRARCCPRGRRAGIRLLRALHRARRRHRARPTPATRHRPSVRSTAPGSPRPSSD